MRVVRSRLVAVVVLLATCVVAWGRAAERVLPGQKLFGELASNERVTVLVDVASGMSLSAKCSAYRGSTPRLDLSLEDPDGTRINLVPLRKSNAKATLVWFKGLKLFRTGSYRLTVSTAVGAPGGFDLAVTATGPAAPAGAGTIDVADAVWPVSFEALPGDKVTCTVRPAKRSKVKPLLVKFVDAGGAERAIGTTRKEQVAPSIVATTGTSRFDVTGANATTGGFTWKVKIVHAKASRTGRDVADLDAKGVISGVIVVDGQSTRPTAAARAEKAARRPRAPDVRVGEFVVSAPDARSFAEVEAAAAGAMPGARCSVVAALTDKGPYLVRVEHLAGRVDARSKSATRALAKSAAAAGSFEWAEPNGIAAAYDEPNDVLYSQQYYLRALRLAPVWAQTEGDPSIVVAVLDTGYLPHPDLVGQIVGGYDFVTDAGSAGDGGGWDPDPTDSAYALHGTHVAGIIGARSYNKIGIAGVVHVPQFLLIVRALGKGGYGSFFDLAAGLRWAVGLPVAGVPANPTPARVVNMSFGAHSDSAVMRQAVADVFEQTNAVLVAAAGNEATSDPSYPAAYPKVVAVYALDANLYWTSYTNYGSWISVGAPGGDPYREQAGIVSTYWDMATNKPDYEELSGTSMASPQVAGVAALLAALKPTITAVEMKDALEKTALDLGDPGFDTDFGWGMVNAQAAADYVLTPFAPPDAIDVAPTSLSFDGVSTRAQVFVRTRSQTPVTVTQIETTTDQLSGWLTASIDHPTTPATVTVDVDPNLVPGAYSGKVRLATSVGVVDVPVRAVRTPRATLNLVIVSAVDELGNVVAQTTTSAAKGWAYSLPDVPLGRYRVTALADQNADLALDRVDEWEGTWPILTQPQFLDVTPDSLDGASIDVPLSRYDARFGYAGVGAGHVAGAVAVRTTDARTGHVVEGVEVHVGGGAPTTVGDARGRGVVVGAITGAQVMTVVADGYGPTTRVGSDAQYQSFVLEPPTARPSSVVVATVRGLTASDRDVYLEVGDAKGHVVYAGGADPQFTLAVTDSTDPVPVSASVFDVAGTPTRHAVYEVASVDPAIDVQTTALGVGGPQARYVQPSAPASNFTTSGSTLTSAVSLRWNDALWLDVGETPLTFGVNKQAWWADPGTFDPALPMKFEVAGTDASGRSSRRIFYGDTVNLQALPGAFTLDTPTALTAPANNATNVSTSPTLTWNGGTGAHLHKIVIEQTGTQWRWTMWVAGQLNTLQTPPISKGGLAAATDYRWSVETYRFAGGFDASSYRDDRIDTTCTSRTFSGWAAFKTQ